MKRSWRGVLILSFMLLANIVLTQQTVNNYYYERYELTILFAALNVVVFPVAYFIYKMEANR